MNSVSSGNWEDAVKTLPSFVTVTVTVATILSYSTPDSVPLTSSTVYLYVPSSPRLNSSAENLMFPDASFLTVSITFPSLSLSTKLNSPSFSWRPSSFLVKLNSTGIGTLFTRFWVGFSGVSTDLLTGL